MLEQLKLLLSQIEDLMEITDNEEHHGLYINLLTFRRITKKWIRIIRRRNKLK